MSEQRKVPLLLMVWNRQEYTETTLASVVENTKYPYELHIVDNASDKKTKDWLDKWVAEHPDLVASYQTNAENVGISPPTQAFWKKMQARKEPWFGKIDNDIEFPEGWLGRLVEVMENCPKVAVASVCHYASDFEREHKAGTGPKVVTVNGVSHQPRTHVGGCGYLLRAAAQTHVGEIDEKMGMVYGWTKYQNWLNGKKWETSYVYPFVPVGHLGEANRQRIQTPEYQTYEKTIWDFRHPVKSKK